MKLPSKIGAVEFDEDEIRLAVVSTGRRPRASSGEASLRTTSA